MTAASELARFHPASWPDAENVGDLLQRANMQRHVDLTAVALLAEVLGETLDLPAAVTASASACDLVQQLVEQILARSKRTFH